MSQGFPVDCHRSRHGLSRGTSPWPFAFGLPMRFPIGISFRFSTLCPLAFAVYLIGGLSIGCVVDFPIGFHIGCLIGSLLVFRKGIPS